MSFVLLLGALWSGPAHGAEGLAWRWPEAEVRQFRVKADLKLPTPILMGAENNKDARVYEVAMAFDLACRPAKLGKSDIEIECDISAAQFNASALPTDKGLLPGILDEWDEKLVNDATLSFTLSDDGRVKNVDLTGLNERIQRIRFIKDTMHLLLLRVVGAFDLNLPKGGNDEGGPWKQKSQLALQLPVITGMTGSVNLSSVVTQTEGTVVTIDTTGRGALSVVPLVSGPGDTRPPDIYDMDLRSRATFDTSTGCLLTRSYIVQGMPTPGSGGSIGREAAPYIQGVDLVFVAPGTPMANLGPNLDTSDK